MENIINQMQSFIGANSIIGTVIGIAIFWYFFGGRIKTFFSFFFGQKLIIDDGAILRWKHREDIFHNRRVLLTKNINIKSFAILYFIFMLSLISPLLSLIGFLCFMIWDTNKKLANFKDFTFFDTNDFSDKFGKWLNVNINKIDFVSQNLITFGFGAILLSIYANHFLAGLVGVMSLAVFILIGVFLYYNVNSYKANLKLNSYFKLNRLLATSLIGDSKILMLFFVLSMIAFLKGSHISSMMSIITVLNLLLFALIKLASGKTTTLADEHLDIENRDYKNLTKLSSIPNPNSFARGNRWTTPLQLAEYSSHNKDGLILDNYAFYHDTINRSILRRNPVVLNALCDVQLKINPKELRKLMILLGDMGSGKTQYINNIVSQNILSGFKFYRLHIFNDIKGDFVSQLYRKDKDIIISLFDSRASCWCVFTEMNYNIEAGSLFINNLFSTLAGGKKEFFENRAVQVISQSIQEAYYESEGDNKKAWEILFAKIEEFKKEAVDNEDDTEKSVGAVIQIALEILDILRYQIVVEDRKTFSLAQVVYQKDVQIFLLNNENYRTRLTPYLNGFFSAFVGAVMQKDNKISKDEDMLLVADEFLTLASQLDENILNTLLTASRSKGLNSILAMQMLPENGYLSEKIDSSYFAMVVFPVNKKYTLENITYKLGNQECLTTTMTPIKKQADNKPNGDAFSAFSQSFLPVFDSLNTLIGGKKEKNKTYSLGKVEFILNSDIQSMPLYHHLTIIPKGEIKSFDEFESERAFRSLVFNGNINCLEVSEDNAKDVGIAYLGYTHPNVVDFGEEEFVAWDMKDYYLSKNRKVIESKKPMIFTDEELFSHYYKLKFVLDLDEIDEYAKAHNLDLDVIDEMFVAIEENDEKIAKFKDTHSLDEIKEIADKFLAIVDDKERYEFVVKNDLFGCVLAGLIVDEEIKDEE